MSTFHPPDLRRAVDALPPAVRKRWLWWNLPEPASSGTKLHDVVETGIPEGGWHTEAETASLVARMDPRDLARLHGAMATRKPEVGTIYMRSRDRVNGRSRRANVRLDGITSCLMMPTGLMSSQIWLFVDGDLVRTRYMTAIEGARLYGSAGELRLATNLQCHIRHLRRRGRRPGGQAPRRAAPRASCGRGPVMAS